ncbi:MAG: deoxyribonuclease IV [Planctomycetota bacterium]
MALLGAHMSIAGGYHKAVEAAHAAGCDCVQLFTKNNNQWRAKPLTDDDCDRFRLSLGDLGVSHPVAHNSYLINLASPDDEHWKKSIDAMVVEVDRASRLGLIGLVAHPGSYTTSSEEAGLARIAAGLDEVHRQTPDAATPILLETTAGQGSNLGHRFEQLASILDQVADPDRVGVCFDTCHVFAAGYAMETAKEYKATMASLNKSVGAKLVKAFHLNDSLKPFGSRKDRHASIGEGEMGLAPFEHLLKDRRFKKTPMYLETPKGVTETGEDWDAVNLRVLRGLIDGAV